MSNLIPKMVSATKGSFPYSVNQRSDCTERAVSTLIYTLR